jgi:hypothetical protein
MKTYDLPNKYAQQAMRESNMLICTHHKAGIFDDGDPNHPKYNNGINYATGKPLTIFGYDTDKFLRKQY